MALYSLVACTVSTTANTERMKPDTITTTRGQTIAVAGTITWPVSHIEIRRTVRGSLWGPAPLNSKVQPAVARRVSASRYFPASISSFRAFLAQGALPHRGPFPRLPLRPALRTVWAALHRSHGPRWAVLLDVGACHRNVGQEAGALTSQRNAAGPAVRKRVALTRSVQ